MDAPASGPADVLADPAAVALQRAVAGQFRLEREIGRGGMGVVYRAMDEQLHREVAIKTLPTHLAADPQVRSRFLREARTAAALSHPNIVPIFSAAERDAVVYFAMGYVDGESLAERLARDGPMAPTTLLTLLDQLADALGFAHAHGVVHRDVKAENVLLDRRSGRAMVTDFGIARVAESQALTATGTVLGTVHYMSPEQVSGDALDGRSDLYSLGVLSFYALTGRFPFERATAAAVVVAHVNAPAPRVRELRPDCPPSLETLVAKLLAKSPADRPADAAALRQEVAGLVYEAHGSPVVRDVPIPGTTRSEPQVLSSRDAQEVWSRAAELQANTGLVVPPPTFASRDDAPMLTTGIAMPLVKASAVEAGIDARYVDRALDERAAAVATIVQPGELMAKPPGWFLGSRQKLEYTAVIDGELTNDEFEEIADEVRRALGEMVTASAVGRTLTISSAAGPVHRGASSRTFQVYLSVRNGRTQVRIHEDLLQTAVQWFVGLGVGAGMSAGMAIGGLVGNFTHSPPMVVGSVLTWITACLGTARFLVRRTTRKRDAQLQDVLRRVAARANAVIAQRALPSPTGSRPRS